MKCNYCGNEVRENYAFCTACGKKVERSQPEPVYAPQPEPMHAPKSAPIYAPQPAPMYAPQPAPVPQPKNKSGNGAVIAVIIVAVVLIAAIAVGCFALLNSDVFTKLVSSNETVEETTQAPQQQKARLTLNQSETVGSALVFAAREANWREACYPSNSLKDSTAYTPLPDVEDEWYMVFPVDIKNVSGRDIDFNNVCAEYVFNETYTYSSKTVDIYFETDDGTALTKAGILKPDQTVKAYVVASVLEDTKNKATKIDISIGFKEGLENQPFDIDDCDYVCEIRFGK